MKTGLYYSDKLDILIEVTGFTSRKQGNTVCYKKDVEEIDWTTYITFRVLLEEYFEYIGSL